MLIATPLRRQPSCYLQGWPAAGAPARLGVVPVADTAQEVHSRWCCGTIAFCIAYTQGRTSTQATYHPEIHPTVVWARFQAMAEVARLASAQLWGSRTITAGR